MTNKLYKVSLVGMRDENTTDPVYGIAYVIATDPTSAHEKVVSFMENENIGTQAQREMEQIELIAENTLSPNCRFILHE